MSCKFECRGLKCAAVPLALLYACLPVFAAPPVDLSDRVDAIAEAAISDGPIAGMSVLVADGDTILHAKGYGFADLENRVPATAQTVYKLGSLSKQFTAVAILQLVEAEKIDLDAEVTDYLTDYPTQGHRVTVRHLLQHTSGIASYTGQSDYWRNIRLDLPHDDVLSWFKGKPFGFAPGERYIYNNSGYYLLGLIIEKVSGQSYEEYIRQHVFEPLALRQTYYAHNRNIIPSRARGYALKDGAFENARWLSMDMPFSTGGLASTVIDFFRFHRALAHYRLIGTKSYRLMTTTGTLNDGEPIDYGMALHVEKIGGRRVHRHGGVIFGFKASYYRYPAEDLTIIIFTNTEQAEYRPIQRAIASIFIEDLPPAEDWN